MKQLVVAIYEAELNGEINIDTRNSMLDLLESSDHAE